MEEKKRKGIIPWFISLRWPRKVAIVTAIITVLAVGAYATTMLWNYATGGTTLTKEKYIKVDLSGATATGTIKPGDTVEMSPALTNNGDIDVTAFIKLTMPVVNGSPAYEFNVKSSWTELEDQSDPESGVFIYGYGSAGILLEIAPSEATDPLINGSFKLKSTITGSQFNNLKDIDIKVTGYMVDAEEGTVPETIWQELGQ